MSSELGLPVKRQVLGDHDRARKLDGVTESENQLAHVDGGSSVQVLRGSIVAGKRVERQTRKSLGCRAERMFRSGSYGYTGSKARMPSGSSSTWTRGPRSGNSSPVNQSRSRPTRSA